MGFSGVSYSTPAQFNVYGLPAVALDGFGGVVQDYLDTAFAEVNSYLRGRYDLPMTVSPPPIELVKAECVVAGYDLISVRGFDPERGADRIIILRYDKTMKWLMAIADGKVNLDIDSDATPGFNDGGPIVSSKVRDSSERFV